MMKIALYGRGRAEEPEWVVILTLAVALLIGWLVQTSVVNRMQTATAGNTSISYPANWVKAREDGSAFSATDHLGGGNLGARISIRQVPVANLQPANLGGSAGTPSLVDAASAWSIQRGAGMVGYRVLKIEPTTLQGREAVDVSYAYLAESSMGAAGTVIPQVAEAVDTLVAAGDQIEILTFAAPSNEFAGLSDLHRRVLASWRLP